MRFSVIIPLYNKGPYIKKALNSVISQTFSDFELILVDDGSTDDSLGIAKRVLEGCKVRHLLRQQENAGASTARNKGVAISHGEYICFLDADDWWHPRFLERMNWFIDEYPEAKAYGSNYFYVKNNRQKICVTTAKTGYINYCQVYANELKMPLWTGATCISRAIFDKMEGFKPNLKLGEDFDLWIRIALRYRVAFLNEPLSYYYQDSDATWRMVGKLYDPSVHMLWNLDYLEDEEKKNLDYKRLIDNLHTYNLLPYYLSKEYRNSAKKELAKVDWEKQPKKTRIIYSLPVSLIKCRMVIMKCGSLVKQSIIKHL